MGADCTKQCLFHVPDTRRRPPKTKARLGTPPRQCDCVRVRSLRDTAFRSGFHLGLKVRKLERLLKAVDAGDYSRSESSAALVVNEQEASELKTDETVEPVTPDTVISAIVGDDKLYPTRQVVPHSFELLLKDDFKWVVDREQCDASPASLP